MLFNFDYRTAGGQCPSVFTVLRSCLARKGLNYVVHLNAESHCFLFSLFGQQQVIFSCFCFSASTSRLNRVV